MSIPALDIEGHSENCFAYSPQGCTIFSPSGSWYDAENKCTGCPFFKSAEQYEAERNKYAEKTVSYAHRKNTSLKDNGTLSFLMSAVPAKREMDIINQSLMTCTDPDIRSVKMARYEELKNQYIAVFNCIVKVQSPIHRQLLMAIYLEGMTIAEASEIIDKSETYTCSKIKPEAVAMAAIAMGRAIQLMSKKKRC